MDVYGDVPLGRAQALGAFATVILGQRQDQQGLGVGRQCLRQDLREAAARLR